MRDPLLPLPHRVCRREQETHDTWTLELETVGGAAPLGFAPGQFNMMYAFGVGEAPISVSGDPAQPGRTVHTIRDVGAVTGALCRAEPGTILGLRGPFGSTWPIAAAAGGDVIFVAGGIGLAPLRPAIHATLARRKEYGRVALLVGARAPEDLIFRSDLDAWRRDLQVEVTVDHAGPGWSGSVGVVTRLLPRARCEPRDTTAFLCGPEVMMKFSVQGLLARGVSPAAIHVSMERNMRCAVGFCGHCQLGAEIICASGPVYPYPRIARAWEIREL